MAIEPKILFVEQLKSALEDKLTLKDLKLVASAVTEIMDEFKLEKRYTNDAMDDDLLNAYTSALKVEGRSQKTIDRYDYVIRRMLKFANVNIRQITIYNLRDYLTNEKERGISDGTLEGLREVFTAFFNWLQRESLIDHNPTVNLGKIKCAKKKKEIYTEVDIEKLKRVCKTKRDLAIILFLGATCCRIGEVISLNRNQIVIGQQKCIVHGKGNKERTVYFDSVTAEALKDYLNERTDDCEALFINKCRKRMQAGGVRCMLKRVAESAGVEHVHPHKFRRWKATMMAKHGMPIQYIQAILGHEKMDTTMKYVQMDEGDIERSYWRYA